MYKYIIYCSVSAAIIIACKYLYQHWIRQNHTIANLKQELGLLNDKVKRLETELERNKNSISGGIKIPIVFKSIEHNVELENNVPSSPKTVQLVKDETSLVSNLSNGSNGSNCSNCSKKSSVKQLEETSKESSKSKKELNIEEITADLDKELENISLPDLNLEEDLENAKEILIEQAEKPKKTTKKKNLLPEAKDYNNGDRITDESGVEYICVVGKRGGHSWKKL
jgi:hypothetical protein